MVQDLCGPWRCVATGDMTLAVLDAAGQRILRIDLLGAGTLRAGDEGQRLAVAYNDLTALAAIPVLLAGNAGCVALPHPEVGLSPFPWEVEDEFGSLIVRDAGGRKIAGASPRSQAKRAHIEQISRLVGEGVLLLNALYRDAARRNARHINRSTENSQ